MTTNTTPEIWTDPEGELAELHYVGMTDFGDDGWYAEGPGQHPPCSYAMVSLTDGQPCFEFSVAPLDPWSPYDAASDLLLREGWTPPTDERQDDVCEHGLSAALCEGPNHYGYDR